MGTSHTAFRNERSRRARIAAAGLVVCVVLCAGGVHAQTMMPCTAAGPCAREVVFRIPSADFSAAMAAAPDAPLASLDRDQDAAPEPTKPTRGFVSALTHNLVDDVKHLPRRNSVYWLAGGGVAALAVHPFDHELNQRLLGSGFADAFFAPGKYIGATEVQISASFTTYIFGRIHHYPRVQHLAMDLLEAQILAEGIVEGAKVVVRRQRPTNPDGTHAAGYSFPSGHAAVTFASATVLQQHLGWKAALPTFTLATYVATSRLHDNRHFLSDVVFGAATGIIIGRSVTWHGRNTYTVMAAPLPGGARAAIIW